MRTFKGQDRDRKGRDRRFRTGLTAAVAALAVATLLSGCIIVPDYGPPHYYHHHYWR